MLIADLKAMAAGLGVAGAGSMKKAQLVEAIKAAQSGGQPKQDQPKQDQPKQDQPKQDQPKQDQPKQAKGQGRGQQKPQQSGNQSGNQAGNQAGNQQGKSGQGGNQNNQKDQGNQGSQQGNQNNQPEGDDDEGGRRSRRRRGRERDRSRRGDVDTTILEDDVLVPAAGILDVLDNYAFVRTSGYLAGTDDVYVSLTMVRKYGLRRGDAVTGQVRQPREGERKEKFNPMVKIESVNGQEPDASRHRPDFTRLTPLYPSERLRLETGPTDVVGRVVDLLAPVGKGQRGMIVAPPGSGRTTLLQALAASITANNPECHLMVVLLDERPEEVTDVERTVKGEVIASTFDRQPTDHTSAAELAVERAKRLVELGHDVVVLLDGITRLTRAYDLAAPASGRALEGGLDPQSLHPAKKLFGAARNIENGGSLTILATAESDSASATDQRILEEFRGTGNHELRLRGDLAARRVFPAVDVVASGTRRVDLLLSAEELAVVETMRRGLAEADPQQALELLLDRVQATQTNYELLRQVQAAGGVSPVGR
ncbi:transcription termination factor Rho [Nocardioides sp. REDSEA-S30_B4]|jgi:transcription termination factor Rho|uniref:transcription termination factor Rho n=1 Tax=Nocardioides sp. REDSEA-S30_B4 TaxID=1811552 RepID=UPI0025D453CC|nr:transcription termination factor Rho [Nocardioides sp. REDSEA-S30_B4]